MSAANTQPAPAAAAQPVPIAAATAGRGKSCLIVDDSRVMRAVSRRVVASLGFAVQEAENGEEALARCAATGMPYLILLDWNMPVMTGIEFIAALRAQDGGARPKVVFCTTENDPTIVGRGIAAGADGFFTKPYDDQTLLAKLQRIGAA